MIIPTKHENLKESLITLGSEVLRKTKSGGIILNDLFNEFKEEHKNLNIDDFFLTLIFLWLVEAIEIKNYLIKRR